MAIVGGGVAGSMLALHLAGSGIRSVVYDSAGAFGRGLAYRDGPAWHRINTPLDKVGPLLEGSADTFLSAYEAEYGAFGPDYATRFVRRASLGDWLSGHLQRAASCGTVDLRRRAVTDIATEAIGRLRVLDEAGEAFGADTVALCLGHHLPRPLPAPRSDRVIQDVWAKGALDRVPGPHPVVIVGTSSTGIDAALDLIERGHSGPILMLSRRGVMPLLDAPPAPYRLKRQIRTEPTRVVDLLARLKAEAREAATEGVGWQAVIDAFRPGTEDVWRALNPEERRRFDRHLRARWLVHRHRIPPDIDARITDLKRRGQLTIRRGRIRNVELRSGDTPLRVAVDGPDGSGQLAAAFLLNCTGPEEDYRRISDPLVQGLLSRGAIRPGEFGIGLDVDHDGRLVDRAGIPHPNLFALGPATRSRFGEIISVPQIRMRASRLAAIIAGELGTARGRSPAAPERSD